MNTMCSDTQLKPKLCVRKQSHISARLRSCWPVFWGHQWSSRHPPISCAWEHSTLDFQRMSFPSVLACTPHNLNCSHACSEEHGELQQQRRGEEKSSRIGMSCSIGCETGNYSEVLLGVPQWTRTLSTGQECNCMSHLFLSRNAKGDFLLKPWPSAKKVLCKSNVHVTVHGQLPPTTFPSTPWNKTKQKTKLP